jgi:hypothetical protein
LPPGSEAAAPAGLFGDVAPPPPRTEPPAGPRPLADRLRPRTLAELLAKRAALYDKDHEEHYSIATLLFPELKVTISMACWAWP